MPQDSYTFLVWSLLSLIWTGCLDDEGFIDSFDFAKVKETQNSPLIPDSDATLMAIRRVAMVQQSGFDVVRTVGEASAHFVSPANQIDLVSAGTVLVKGHYLRIKDNKEYAFNVDLTEKDGSIFDDIVIWDVEGKNGIPRIKKIHKRWPDVGPVNSSKLIYDNEDYTLAIDYLQNADAVCFQIAGINKLLHFYHDGMKIQHTFSRDEVAELGKGPALVQVNAFTIQDTVINGMNINFVNSEASYEVIEIH